MTIPKTLPMPTYDFQRPWVLRGSDVSRAHLHERLQSVLHGVPIMKVSPEFIDRIIKAAGLKIVEK